MGITERRAREKEELRGRILEAATSLFVEEGYPSVSIRRIADRIEYAPSTIYLYFKDKNDIVHSICRETFQRLDEAMDDIICKRREPLETLRLCLRCYVDFGLAHPNHYLVTFGTPESQYRDISPKENQKEVLEAGLGTFDRLRQGLRTCMEAGVVRPDDVETTAQSVWAMVHGLTHVMITMPTFPFVDREILIRSTIQRMINSLHPANS